MSARDIRVALLGECMVELQGRAFGAMQQSFGGDTLNTAVYLARCGAGLGIKTFYATALGDDALSSGMLQRWADEGLDLCLVRRIPGRMPGIYQIALDDQGERTFFYWRDTSAAKVYFEAGAENHPTLLENPPMPWDALYLSGISLAILPPQGRERVYALMQALRAAGAQVVFDNNYRPRLWPDIAMARQCFERAFALATIALVTLDDHQLLFDLPDATRATQAVYALSTPEVVLKRGHDASLVRCGTGAWESVATCVVDTVVDTTAAGDSFAGGYLSRRLSGASASQAVGFGNRLAARVIQHPGALIAPSVMQDLV